MSGHSATIPQKSDRKQRACDDAPAPRHSESLTSSSRSPRITHPAPVASLADVSRSRRSGRTSRPKRRADSFRSNSQAVARLALRPVRPAAGARYPGRNKKGSRTLVSLPSVFLRFPVVVHPASSRLPPWRGNPPFFLAASPCGPLAGAGANSSRAYVSALSVTIVWAHVLSICSRAMTTFDAHIDLSLDERMRRTVAVWRARHGVSARRFGTDALGGPGFVGLADAGALRAAGDGRPGAGLHGMPAA